MATIDIRNEVDEEITKLVFADDKSSDGALQAHVIERHPTERGDYFIISDDGESVIINTKEHAQNLIKALNKAIELGWVK